MKLKHLLILLVALAALLVILSIFKRRPGDGLPMSLPNEVVTNATSVHSNAIVQDHIIGTTNQQPSQRSRPDRLSWEKTMAKQDPYYNYKLPISFFGKVVDDQTQSVAGAIIDFSWTDLSEAGTSQESAISDQNGFFSLTGVRGGVLTVQVHKAGYRHYVSNRSRFEFAYGGPAYYQPDSGNPIVFLLRKDHPGESLIVRSRRQARIEPGQTRSFPIGNGDISIAVERLPDREPNSGSWDAMVSIPNGALQLTTEEFPYEAPEDGYANTFIITNGLSIIGNQGGMFYIKTPGGYGRAMVYYVPNMPWVYVESWFNPDPTSRNLEVDPSKIIKP